MEKVRLSTDGLILRETPVGEADKFITVLTREHGLVRAAARGARRANSRMAAATQPLTHAKLSLQAGKSSWYVDDARPLHVFFELRNDLEKLALAQYFCELASHIAPRDEPAEEELRLLLNALHYLATDERPAALVKAVVEGRLLAAAGYAPQLWACHRCGAAEGAFRLLPFEGWLQCDDCGEGGVPLSPAALTAFRYLLDTPLERCFAFALPDADAALLENACETFLRAQLGRGFATLDFYHTLHSGKDEPFL